jgi:hypothetical protein
MPRAITTVTGRKWSGDVLSQILTSGRISGRRECVPAPASNFAFGLAVVSSINAWGIGGPSGCAARCYTGLLHWTGHAWQAGRVWLTGVSPGATATGQVWAVGQAQLNSAGMPAGPVEAYTWSGGALAVCAGDPRLPGRAQPGTGRVGGPHVDRGARTQPQH